MCVSQSWKKHLVLVRKAWGQDLLCNVAPEPPNYVTKTNKYQYQQIMIMFPFENGRCSLPNWILARNTAASPGKLGQHQEEWAASNISMIKKTTGALPTIAISKWCWTAVRAHGNHFKRVSCSRSPLITVSFISSMNGKKHRILGFIMKYVFFSMSCVPENILKWKQADNKCTPRYRGCSAEILEL